MLTRLLEPRPWEAFEHQITIVRYTMVDERLPSSYQLKRPTHVLQLPGEHAALWTEEPGSRCCMRPSRL
jgi:hypothetical protein